MATVLPLLLVFRDVPGVSSSLLPLKPMGSSSTLLHPRLFKSSLQKLFFYTTTNESVMSRLIPSTTRQPLISGFRPI
ncbi:hypothetical protein EYF80_042240 [Liparis tanakae]|uniref:Secreted protein n=1 Tax=Liparis tanakae TaxID=230148 RepID=A0A4Z2G1X9_9TELE|nr:hypothetical protein EYF80_042240 [Liparis tanakae]